MSPGEIDRFMGLFQGLERGYGQYRINGERDKDGKLTGKAVTIRAPLERTQWEEHFAGEVGLGIVPIDDDGLCWWGAIDVDVYDLDLDELSKKISDAKLPLITITSKSGGAHLYLFMNDAVPAAWMMETLQTWAAALGFAGSEVFPKQKRLASTEDVGNWLNMPYFNGDTRTMWPDKEARYFLMYAEHMASINSVESINAIQVVAPDVDPWDEAPPCLRIIASDKEHQSGGRNIFLFNYGVFATKAYGKEDIAGRLKEANQNLLDSPLPEAEIQTIAKSLGSDKDYGYQCATEPLCSHCKPALCRRKKFGVGSTDGFLTVEIRGLTKFTTEPPVWLLDIDGARIELTTRQLNNFEEIKLAAMDRLTTHIGHMPKNEWSKMMAQLLEECEEVEMPEDGGLMGAFKELLMDFLATRRSVNKDDLLNGSPWYSQKEDAYYFRAKDLLVFMDNRRFRDLNRSQVAGKLKQLGAASGQFNMKGTCVRYWRLVPLMPTQTEDFDVNVEPLPHQGEA